MINDFYTAAYRRDLKNALEQLWMTEGRLPEHKIDDPAIWLDQFEIRSDVGHYRGSNNVFYFTAKHLETYRDGHTEYEYFPYYYRDYEQGPGIDEVIDNGFLDFVIDQISNPYATRRR